MPKDLVMSSRYLVRDGYLSIKRDTRQLRSQRARRYAWLRMGEICFVHGSSLRLSTVSI